MGVPSFYRWLADKYAKVVVDCLEDDAAAGQIDASQPNPNGIEFDALYLDVSRRERPLPYAVRLTRLTLTVHLSADERHHPPVRSSGGPSSSGDPRGDVRSHLFLH